MEIFQGVAVLPLVLASLVVVVQSQAMPNPPAHCCFPDKFNVTITDLNTVNNDKITMRIVQTDFLAKRQLVKNFIFSPQTTGAEMSLTKTEVLDFLNRKLYTIEAFNSSACYVSDSFVQPDKCIPPPDNRTPSMWLGSMYVGPQLSPMMQNGWRHTRQSEPPTTVTTSVSQVGCIPLIQGFSNGQKSDLLFYTNFADSGDFPTIDIPVNCANSPKPNGRRRRSIMFGVF